MPDILRVFFVLVVPFLFAILPWFALRQAVGVQNYDFSFSRALEMNLFEFMNVIKSSVRECVRGLFFNWRTNFIFWLCMPAIAVFFFGKEKRKAEDVYYICFGLSFIFLICFSFIFSMRPLDWHLRSMSRVLLLPQIFIFLSAVR
jgi:hypothetical protein